MTDFLWPVAVSGYKWDEFPDGANLRCGLEPIRKWPLRQYAPLEEFTGLFRTFAETEPTKEGVLAFANQFGPLGAGPLVEGMKDEVWASQGVVHDLLEDWQEEIPLMRKAI